MFKVLEAGFFTTIQDRGRFGYRDKGVPVSGYMDAKSATIANSLLENEATDALLEITMTGPTLQFDEPSCIALSGAEMSASLNGVSINNYEVHRIEAGDLLSFGKLQTGFRSYLAIKGGLRTEQVLNSRSYFKSLTSVNRLATGDEIPYKLDSDFEPKITHLITEPFHKKSQVEVSPGPEYELLDKL